MSTQPQSITRKHWLKRSRQHLQKNNQDQRLMWPLHARSKDEYIRLIEQHMERQEIEPLNEMIHQAFEDYRQEEDFTAWCASVAYGVELPEAPALQAQFMQSFPLSLQPVQVDYAEQLIWQGQVDTGSNEARAYLHRVAAAGLEDYFEKYELVRDAISRAFIILTAVYTEVGARSYSKRLLEYVMVLQLESYWQQRFRVEHARLCEELADDNLAKLDEMWESFFHKHQNLNHLLDLCSRCHVPILAKRLEVLADRFQEEPDFKLGDEEMLQMVYQTDRGSYVLA